MLKIKWGTSKVVTREEFMCYAEIDREHAEFHITDVPLQDLLNAACSDFGVQGAVSILVEDGGLFASDMALWYDNWLSKPNNMAIGVRVDISEWLMEVV